jgi:histidine triad (HIT) family protein
MNSSGASGDCAFCAISAGLLPSSQVYSDEDLLAFLDIRPVNTGHLLVVPRVHAASLADLCERIGARLFVTAQRLAAALRASGLPCDGVNLFLADGAAAGQEVDHVHLHVVPRQAGDGFELRARFQHPDRSHLDAAAAAIRKGQSVRGGGQAPDS